MNELEKVIAEADEKNIGTLIGDLKVMGELYFSLIQKEMFISSMLLRYLLLKTGKVLITFSFSHRLLEQRLLKI